MVYPYFSKEMNNRKRKLKELQEKVKETNKKFKLSEENVQKLTMSQNDESTKKKILENITDLQIERDELNNILKRYEENDPQILETKRTLMQVSLIMKY